MELIFAFIFIIAFFALAFNAMLVLLQIGIVLGCAWWVLKIIAIGMKKMYRAILR